MKADLAEVELTPVDDDIEALEAGRISLDMDVTANSPSNRLFNSLLWLLNTRTYKFSFNLLLSSIILMQLLIFINEENSSNMNVTVLRYVCCVGIQITAFLVVLILLYGLSTCQNRRVLTRCLLDTFVWIPTSALSILSLQDHSVYLTASTILLLTSRLLSHNSLRWVAASYLAPSGGGKINPRLLPILTKGYQPFLAESRFSFVVLVLSSCWIAVSSALGSFLSGVVLNSALSKDPAFNLHLLALILVVASAPPTFMFQSWLLGRTGGKAVATMQRRMLDRVCHGNSKFVENHAPGKLANTFGGSLKQLYLLWDQNFITRILIPVINVVVVIGFIGTVNVAFMLLCIASLPIFFSIKPIQRKSMETSKEMTKSFAVSQTVFENVVSLRKAIKASATTKPLLDKIFNPAADSITRNVVAARTWAGVMAFLYAGGGAMLAILAFWVFYTGLYEGVYTAGEVIQVSGYLGNFGQVVGVFGRGVQYIVAAQGDIQDLFELLDNDDMENQTRGTNLKPVSSSIVFNKIKKECPGLPHPILDIDHLSIKAGSMCSILGSSGAGKSTLLHCLARSIPYDSGDIYFDNQPVSETSLNSYREQVAVVFQETMVLNGTIAENIAFGRDITQAAIEEAAQEAEIHDFIQNLPHGYSTEIGKDFPTTNLSGGQLQRIAGLARAFAGRPKVLLLDEATSGLDPESERSIIKTLEKMKGKRTIISVTHRHETALSSDLVVILDAGKVLKSGKYAELYPET